MFLKTITEFFVLVLCYTAIERRETMDKKYVFLSMATLLTASCESGSVEYKYPEKIKGKYEMVTAEEAEQRNDTFIDKKRLTFNFNKTTEEKKDQPVEKTEQAVSGNQPLWKNVLPVLSRYPVAEIHQDAFMATEWFSDPENASRQLKINAVKTGEGVRITVLCRQKDKNGEWVNQKNDEALADKIKDDIVKQSLNN